MVIKLQNYFRSLPPPNFVSMPVPLKQYAPVTATLHSTCSLLPPAVKHCKALLSDASLLLVLHDHQYSVPLTSQVLVLTSGFPGLFLTTVPGASPARSLSLGLQLGHSPSADVTTDYPSHLQVLRSSQLTSGSRSCPQRINSAIRSSPTKGMDFHFQ